ncbi:MAG: dicarboxylate/amino acid:cation symporter [Atopobiaceae bacterium]|jgi:Na+/H+-dicarboxylate symporter|nr:dicarboxylate/amino acid:cation symporter [Atopobiaceae bacterium]
MAKKEGHSTLMVRMVVAVVGGILLGLGFIFFRESVGADSDVWGIVKYVLFANVDNGEQGIGVLYIISKVFLNALQMGMVPLVFVSLSLAICAIENAAKLGRVAAKAIGFFGLFYLISVVCAEAIGWTVKSFGFFNVELASDVSQDITKIESYNPFSIITGIIPSNVGTAFSSNNAVLSIIFISVVVGISLHKFPDETRAIRDLLEGFDEVIQAYLDFLISKVGQFAIFCMMTKGFATYGTDYLKSAMAFVVTGVVAGPLLLLIIYPTVIWLTTRLSPIPFLKKTLKTGLIASATNSSAAALPMNMKACIEDLGCGDEVSSFVLPTGMTVHMNGTSVMQCISIIFIATSAGIDMQPYQLVLLGLFAIVTAISTPAVPMAGTVMLFVTMTALGFTSDPCVLAYALIVAINYPVGMAVIPMNVVGDAAVSVIVSNGEGDLNKTVYNS